LKYVSIPAKKCLAQRKKSSLPVTLGVFRYTLKKKYAQTLDAALHRAFRATLVRDIARQFRCFKQNTAENSAILNKNSAFEGQIRPVKRSIYAMNPRRGFLEAEISKKFHPPGRLTHGRKIL